LAVEMVEAIPLTPFGLQGPDALPCLALPYHVAQKIHAMTFPSLERPNDRFRDLVDLLLLQEWVHDFAAVRSACEETFRARATHPWPPFFDPPPHWAAPFEQLATEVGLHVTELQHAALFARHLIQRIDPSAPVFQKAPLPADVSVTTWYFVLGGDSSVHRIPSSVGDALVNQQGVDRELIAEKWEREPDGVVVVGVVLLLRDRRPCFVERVALHARALGERLPLKEVSIDQSDWRRLATELLRLSKGPSRSAPLFSVFLAHQGGVLPCEVAARMGVGARYAHTYYADFLRRRGEDQLLWDIEAGRPVISIPPLKDEP
jgi:hypothetical protein